VFAINLSAVYICEYYLKQLLELIPFADFVFGNEDETTAFAKSLGIEYTNLHEVTTHIAKLPKHDQSKPRTVTTTQGKSPVLCSVYNHEC